MTAQIPTEPTNVKLSPNSSMLESDEAADITQIHETSTWSCTSTEQTKSSTVEPPTATFIAPPIKEITLATTHTEQVLESQLFQDSEEIQARVSPLQQVLSR
jgi:hypothetical protein